jgi:peptidoglycan/LPS O-acetylase OafA/YrhL
VQPALSTYLDLVRFTAAALVFLHHFAFQSLTAGRYAAWGELGEDAVMIFFVLSGYVIAYVTDQREKSLPDYGISRLARLYSVVVPAVIVTLILDSIGRSVDPGLYQPFSGSYVIPKTIITLGFVNQIWALDIRFLSNWPYWSISYEFWYYVLFACLVFAKGSLRVTLAVVWALIVGPCILLLLPVWLLGVAVYHLNQRVRIRRAWALTLFVAPVPAYVLYRWSGVGDALTAFTDAWVVQLTGNIYSLHKARFFLHDYIVGVLVTLNFIGAFNLFKRDQLVNTRIDAHVRSAAGYTFTLYLFHFPVLFFLAAFSPWAPTDPLHAAYLVLGTAIAVLAFGAIGEKRKSEWRTIISWFWERSEKYVAPRAA